MAAQQQLGDWQDQIPPEVASAAADYDSAHTAANKAKGTLNTAKDNLIGKMRDTGCLRCPIRNGEKFLELKETEGVKYAKPKENPGSSSDVSSGTDNVTMRRGRGGRMQTIRTPKNVAAVANDAGAAMPLLSLKKHGITPKKCEAISAAVGGDTIGHLEKAMRTNVWWHRDLKGFGQEWVDRLTDALAMFRKEYPVPAEDEAPTILDDVAPATEPETAEANEE